MYNDCDYTALCAREAMLQLNIEHEEIEERNLQKKKNKIEEEQKLYAIQKAKEEKEKCEIREDNRRKEIIEEIPKNIHITYIRNGVVSSECNKNARIKDKYYICIDDFTFHITWIYTLDLSDIFIEESYSVLIAKNKNYNEYKAYKQIEGRCYIEEVTYPTEIVSALNLKKSKKIWEDLLGSIIPENSSLIEGGKGEGFYSAFTKYKHGPYSYENFTQNDKSVFIDERHAKSALAMAQISQLIPYYGGIVTDIEWDSMNTCKYVIEKRMDRIYETTANINYHFLAFHTKAQRDEFTDNNEKLIKDYLMIE